MDNILSQDNSAIIFNENYRYGNNMIKYISLIAVTAFSLVIVSCSSSEAKPEKKMGFWGKAKCKFLKKTEECE